MNNVTIISDASVCPNTKVAAWAAWMKADGKASAMHSGAFDEPVGDSSMAETLAIINAIHRAVTSGYVEKGGNILMQSDSLDALAVLMIALPGTVENKHASGAPVYKMRKKTSERYSKAIKILRKIVAEHHLVLEVRHVRGHKSGNGRQYVNRLVDKEAKAIVRANRGKAKQDG